MDYNRITAYSRFHLKFLAWYLPIWANDRGNNSMDLPGNYAKEKSALDWNLYCRLAYNHSYNVFSCGKLSGINITR